MTPAEFRSALDELGLSITKASKDWGYGRNSLHRWLRGDAPIPPLVVLYVRLRLRVKGLTQ